MFKTRLISGIILVIVLIATVGTGGNVLFGLLAVVSLIGLDKVNYIITDSRPSDEWVAYCESHEIQLIY
jgi:phosphatidate cytidylyltransferase